MLSTSSTTLPQRRGGGRLPQWQREGARMYPWCSRREHLPSLFSDAARGKQAPMVAPSAWECSQTFVQARTASGAFPTGRGARSAVSPDASPIFLDRMQAVGDGMRHLLQEMRRADPALYEHSLQVWELTQQLATCLQRFAKRLPSLKLSSSGGQIPTVREPASGISRRNGSKSVFKSLLESLTGARSDPTQD